MPDEPDFSEFDDWRLEHFNDRHVDADWTPSEHQKAIIDRNFELLSDEARWNLHCRRFLELLQLLPDPTVRKRISDEYFICFCHVDFHAEDKYTEDDFLSEPLRLDFSHRLFPVLVDFSFAKFIGGEIMFAGSTFEATAIFRDCTFTGHGVYFDEARFKRNRADFYRANFSCECISFAGASFSGSSATFSGASFRAESVRFNSAKFTENGADFGSAVFQCRSVNFFGAEFAGGSVHFANTIFFCDLLEFDRVTSGKLFALSATCQNDMRISICEATFSGVFDLSINNSIFLELAGSTFESNVYLKTISPIAVPDLRYSKFNRPPDISHLRVKFSPNNDIFVREQDSQLPDKFRVLKVIASDAGDHQKAGQFFAMEMAAKRGTEITGWAPLLITWLYMTFSNFGQSYVRPLLGILVLWCFAFSLFFGLQPANCSACNSPWTAAELATRNLIPFVGSLLRFTPQPDTHSFRTGFQTSINEISRGLGHNGYDLFIYLGFAEQFLGSILLFLLLLGLRNVFRMK